MAICGAIFCSSAKALRGRKDTVAQVYFYWGGAIAPLAPPGIDATVSVEILPIATQQCIDTTCTTGPEEIEVMKLEGYSRAMCNKYVQSTMTRSSCFHCPIGP